MKKQKMQMIIFGIILVIVVVFFFLVDKIPKEDAVVEKESYQVTNIVIDEITKFSFTNENGTFSFSKSGDEWLSDEDDSLDIDESQIETMIKKVNNLSSEDKITGVTDLGIYGLDDPQKVISLSDNEQTYTLLIGDYNSTLSVYYMYLQNEPSTVYTLVTYDISSFDNSLEDLVVEEESSTESVEN